MAGPRQVPGEVGSAPGVDPGAVSCRPSTHARLVAAWLAIALTCPSPVRATPEGATPEGASPGEGAVSAAETPTPVWVEVPEQRREIPPGQIEILAGSERRLVPIDRSNATREGVREKGVLPIRGATVGPVEPSFEINRKSLSLEARGDLRERLGALVRLYREAFAAAIETAEARDLQILNVTEERGTHAAPLERVSYRHELEAPPSGRRARERALAKRALHATSHVIVARHFPGAPFWLDEGLASLLEGVSLEADGDVRTALTAEHRERLHPLLESRAGISLPKLLALDRATWEGLDPREAQVTQALMSSLVVFALGDARATEALEQALVGEPFDPESLGGPLRRDAFETRWLNELVPAHPLRVVSTAPPAPAPEEPRERRIRQRGLRCVRGFLRDPSGKPRPTLFCRRLRRYSQD